MNAKFFEEQRREMVAAIKVIAEHMAPQIGKAGLDERVIRAMAKVPRQEFVPVEVQQYAYLNRPFPIGFDKTISQPLMVAGSRSACWAPSSLSWSRRTRTAGSGRAA